MRCRDPITDQRRRGLCGRCRALSPPLKTGDTITVVCQVCDQPFTYQLPGGGVRPRSCEACAPISKRMRDREYHLTRMSLTPEGYAAMVAAQGGSCAVCLRKEPGGKGEWHIDHDHDCCAGVGSCGWCVRGLLCCACNRGRISDALTVKKASFIVWCRLRRVMLDLWCDQPVKLTSVVDEFELIHTMVFMSRSSGSSVATAVRGGLRGGFGGADAWSSGS